MSSETLHSAADIAVIVQSIIALLAAIAAFWTIKAMRDENKRWQTLNVCAQYEFNDTVSEAAALVYKMTSGIGESKWTKPADADELNKFSRAAITVLNYLDSIAIGVKQWLYIEDLAKDHLKFIVETHVANLIDSSSYAFLGLNKSEFSFIYAMNEKWKQNKLYFRA